MKNLLAILLVLMFAAPAVAATDENRTNRYYVRDDANFAVIYKGKRYGVDRDYRYYPYGTSYNPGSPMSEFLSICSGVKERKRNDCIQDAIKERQKLIEKYRD